MKAVGYIRVSTAQQADSGVSIEAQRAKVESYADLYDFELVDVQVDEGASAKTLDRDGLQAALDVLESGDAEALIVVKLDRLTRSVRDLDTLLTDYFADDGFTLVSVNEQVDTSTATGRMILNVLMSVSQWEREVIGERTSEALQHKAEQGEYTGGKVPYGYRLADNGTDLVEDTGEQRIIEAILTYRDSGLSLRKTAARLEERGYYNRNGNTFSASSVSAIEKRARKVV